jgi:hypothetical protein
MEILMMLPNVLNYREAVKAAIEMAMAWGERERRK